MDFNSPTCFDKVCKIVAYSKCALHIVFEEVLVTGTRKVLGAEIGNAYKQRFFLMSSFKILSLISNHVKLLWFTNTHTLACWNLPAALIQS